jgi:hypothetical protein
MKYGHDKIKSVRISLLFFLLCGLFFSTPTLQAQEKLLFCNTPERIKTAGIYSEAILEPGRTYTIFYHYYNVSGGKDYLNVRFRTAKDTINNKNNKRPPLSFRLRQGTADPRRDPCEAGRQAMARFMSSPEGLYNTPDGEAIFRYRVGNRQTISGMLSVTPEERVSVTVYFRHDKWSIKGGQTVLVDAPRYEVEIPLAYAAGMQEQKYRIGLPEPDASQHYDGTYGVLYAFKIAAPENSRVRVFFTPRGGKSGVVGSLNGELLSSDIIEAGQTQFLCETTVGKDGSMLITSPFGGVFYPVELVFQLL